MASTWAQSDSIGDTQPSDPTTDEDHAHASPALGLVIVYARAAPERVGEVAFFGVAPTIVGRGDAVTDLPRAAFVRQRPGRDEARPPLDDLSISRVQLRVRQRGDHLFVEQLGRAPLLLDGRSCGSAEIEPGDLVGVGAALRLLCVARPRELAPVPHPLHPFGAPDGAGLIGESPALWRLRSELAFVAGTTGHVLVTGPSGAGKELVARAVHTLSKRARGPFVARNAATLPTGIVDAELFGNVRNYPNAGTPAREGLVGAANGGTLFLDELADLPPSAHANLLRLLDGDGEYHRLGEATARRAAVRFVGATNRPEALREDLVARFRHRLVVPGLGERREDVPLLVDAILRRASAEAPESLARFLDERGRAQVDAGVVVRLVRHDYSTHVRELERLLWAAMAESRAPSIRWPPSEGPEGPAAVAPDADVVAIRGAMAACGGNVVRAARSLGLSRYALYRLLRQHGVEVDELRRDV